MDNNTKNILYPKGSIFQTLKDDKIDKKKHYNIQRIFSDFSNKHKRK